MDRRAFFKALFIGGVASTMDFDVDKMLWTPGEKSQIFLPGTHRSFLAERDIILVELDRIMHHVAQMFERDDTFFKLIQSNMKDSQGKDELRIPLIVQPRQQLFKGIKV